MIKESEEIWKGIEGLEGLYAVSTKGRVKNLKTNKIFTGGKNNDGYKRVNLKGKWHTVHRLVALAFIPNPYNLPYINHKNERKDDNNVGNLEWCTASYNTNYSSHKQSCKIKQLTLDGELAKIWESSMQIEKETDYNHSYIINCCRGKHKQAYGYRWEYSDTSQQRKYNRPVAAYKGTELIGEFPSAKKASKALGLKYLSVYHCLQGLQTSTKGYKISYVE